MDLDYILDENDYLRYHLYQLKTDKSIKKTMIFSWTFLSLIYGFMLWSFYKEFNTSLGFYVILGVIVIIMALYPKTYEISYKKRVLKFIRKNYDSKNKISLNLEKDCIKATMHKKFNVVLKNITKLVKSTENFFIVFKLLNRQESLAIILKNNEISAKFIELVAEKTALNLKKEL